MSIDITTIVSEETQAVQSEVDARVLARLGAAKQSAQDRLSNAQDELAQVETLIAERTPDETSPEETQEV